MAAATKKGGCRLRVRRIILADWLEYDNNNDLLGRNGTKICFPCCCRCALDETAADSKKRNKCKSSILLVVLVRTP
jgi:hypothetical protein